MVNPVVFFDVSIGGKAAGRIVFTLFAGKWDLLANCRSKNVFVQVFLVIFISFDSHRLTQTLCPRPLRTSDAFALVSLKILFFKWCVIFKRFRFYWKGIFPCNFHLDSFTLRISNLLFPFDLFPTTFYCNLFAGEKGLAPVSKKPLHYKGCVFHRVIPNFMLQVFYPKIDCPVTVFWY